MWPHKHKIPNHFNNNFILGGMQSESLTDWLGEKRVEKALHKMKSDKASGMDGIAIVSYQSG